MTKKLYFDSDAGWSSEADGDEFFIGDDFFLQSPSIDPDNPSNPSSPVRVVTDNTSSTGKVLHVDATANNLDIAKVTLSGIPFGLYSIVVRTKTTINTGSAVVYKISASAGTKALTSYSVKENDYTSANKWETIGMGIDFNGTTGDPLVITLRRDSYSGQAAINFDYVKITPAPVAINAIT